MKRISVILLLGLFVVVNTAFAQMSRNIPVSLTLTGDQVAQFEIYPDATSTTPITSLNLTAAGHTINDNVQYIAGEVYIDFQPGNTGSWYFLIYTANEIQPGWPSGFVSDQANNLLADDGSYASLHWKYNHPFMLYPDTRAVGTTITNLEWGNNYSNEELAYLYLENFPQGVTGAGAFEQASLISYKSNQFTLSFDTNQRLRIPFAVDLNSSCRATTYTANLVFEVYYE